MVKPTNQNSLIIFNPIEIATQLSRPPTKMMVEHQVQCGAAEIWLLVYEAH